MKAVDQLNKMLNSQLMDSKRLVSEYTKKLKDGVPMDLNCQIELIQDLIENNIKLKTEIEKSGVKMKETDEILAETLDHYYTVLRILKRYNKRKKISTSQMAIDSYRHSLKTLQAKLKK